MLFSSSKRCYKINILSLLILTSFLVNACSAIPGQSTPTPIPLEIEDVPPLVSVTGEVVPLRWSRLSMSVQGIVEEVLVDQGDQVRTGDLLVRLEGSEDLKAAIAAAETQVISAEKTIIDLQENADKAKSEAQNNIAVISRQVRDAQYQLDNFTVPQDQIDLTTMEAIAVTQEKLDIARQAFEPYRYYPSGNQTRKDLKEDLDNAQSDYNTAIKRLEYETALEVAEDNLQRALEDYEILKDGPDPQDVKVAKAQLAKANADLDAAIAALDYLELRAPFDGTVSEIDVRVGEYVLYQNPVLLLADLEHLQIETTDLNEIDASRVSIDDTAIVTFDAIPDASIEGIVISIAPKASEGSGVNYTAVIEINDWPTSLRWGMTAFVDIEVEN